MSVDHSTRNAVAALFMIAALFVAMNQVVASAPLTDGWLPLVLFIVGAALAFLPSFDFRRGQADQTTDLPASGVQVYQVAAQQAPRLQTMTIRPDPESAEYTMTVTPEAAASGLDEGFPLNRPPEIAPAAPEVTYTTRTEYANPDDKAAANEAPAVPPPDDSVTSTPRAEPEKEIVAEKTAAPQQPYEAAQVGVITPEHAEGVMADSAAQPPLVSEAASPPIAAQEQDSQSLGGSADDLTMLSGIGPKSAVALKAAGIDSFQKLASSTDEEIRAVLVSAKVRLVGGIDTWAEQASYAERSDWEGLQRFNAGQRSTREG